MLERGSPSPLTYNALRAFTRAAELVASGVDGAGLMGTPDVYGPPGPSEAFVAHLIRLGWVTAGALGGLEVTSFGNALLRADRVDTDGEEVVTVVALPAGSELAYPLLMGHIAASGAAMIVDAFLKVDQLRDLLNHTEADRFLVGPRLSKQELTALVVLVNTLTARPVELRQAAEGQLHDRAIVGDRGVHTVGTSLNGIGKTATHLNALPGAVAEDFRVHFEEIWTGAALRAPTTQLA